MENYQLIIKCSCRVINNSLVISNPIYQTRLRFKSLHQYALLVQPSYWVIVNKTEEIDLAQGMRKNSKVPGTFGVETRI